MVTLFDVYKADLWYERAECNFSGQNIPGFGGLAPSFIALQR
jgi:hypothetical protein